MKKIIYIIILISLFDFLAAQRKSDEINFNEYLNKSKSETKAIFFSSLFPGLGHIYTKDYDVGLMFIIANVGSYSMYLALKHMKSSDTIIIIVLSFLKIYEYFDVLDAVKKYNIKLAKRINFNITNSKINLNIRI